MKAGATPGALRGFALVPAIFLIVVLAALAAFAVRIYGGQQQTVTLALQGARALAAARAGIEWSARRALNGDCSTSSLALSESALAGFSVTVGCSSQSYATAAGTVNVYLLDALATRGVYGSPDFVSRRVRASFTDGG
jgi:MSHA biogenesis protein MshP